MFSGIGREGEAPGSLLWYSRGGLAGPQLARGHAGHGIPLKNTAQSAAQRSLRESVAVGFGWGRNPPGRAVPPGRDTRVCSGEARPTVTACSTKKMAKRKQSVLDSLLA